MATKRQSQLRLTDFMSRTKRPVLDEDLQSSSSEVHNALRLYLVVPVTSATTERTFSVLTSVCLSKIHNDRNDKGACPNYFWKN